MGTGNRRREAANSDLAAMEQGIKEPRIMEKVTFTPEQEKAISYRGGPLLVSAAAGSGKTKVLVERLLGRVREGSDIDEFLVITYTRAAAAELRERIIEEISEHLAADPGNRRLRRQSMLCRCAPIDTIHGFCTGVLRENAHSAGLPPDFRVADENESGIIKSEVLEGVLDAAYETIGESDGFRALVDALSAERDDSRLIRMALDVHGKLQSSPDPRRWAEAQIRELPMPGVSDISETAWGKEIMGKTGRLAFYWLGEMRRVREAARTFPDFEGAYGASLDATISDMEAFLSALLIGWDEARGFCVIGFPRAKAVKGFDDLKGIRDRCKAAMKKCAGDFECSSAEHIGDMRAVAPSMEALLRLVLDFDRAYSEEKRRRGLADFSDLEHLTLALLTDGGTGEKTEIAKALSKRFTEIMVDEYQDVNAVQELIFNAVSQDGGNIFMVGDVKQSIYRFRLADPSIFLAKYRQGREAGEQGHAGRRSLPHRRGSGNEAGDKESGEAPALVLLSRNFRSRAGILKTVNHIFSSVMSTEFGEMDYTGSEALVPGRMDEGGGEEESIGEAESAVEVCVIDLSAEERDGGDGDNAESSGGAEDSGGGSGESRYGGGENPSRLQAEARYIAGRISGLVDGGYKIPDGKGSRRAEYSDIAVLLRSFQGKAQQYAKILADCGIPVDLPGGEGFFETYEIAAALSLLSVIDNPMQDIPLAAALRGPVYGFTADELAEIRAGSRGTDFYGALAKAAGNEKCASFLEEIEGFRTLAPDMPADRFIWHVYNKTGLMGLVGAMRGGARRRGNLVMLAEYARGFEQNGYKGLFGFLTYIRGLQEKGADLPGGAASAMDAAGANSVKLMSIHKSKGLEFPIVFLADTSKGLNLKDIQKPLVMHDSLGMGAMRTDMERRIMYPTIARTAIQGKLISEIKAEELRVLYVAMTRAREKLIITAAYDDAGRELEKLSKLAGADGKIHPQALEGINNMAGWILAPLIAGRGDAGHGDAESGDAESAAADPQASAMRRELCRCPEVSRVKAPAGAEGLPYNPGFQPSTIRRKQSPCPAIPTLSAFVYPHAPAPELPSKLTVTELKGRHFDFDLNEGSAGGEPFGAAMGRPLQPVGEQGKRPGAHPLVHGAVDGGARSGSRFAFERPNFIVKKSGLTAAERGTAMHLAMQYIDFSECGSVEGVEGELRRLGENGTLSAEQAEAVDARKIACFFESGLGKRVMGAENARREFKFSLLCPAEDFYSGGGSDKILLQGVVDCFFEEGGELVVVDFKSDRVTPETLPEKTEQYAPQLNAYRMALERITGKKVKDSYLYFFDLDVCIPISQGV